MGHEFDAEKLTERERWHRVFALRNGVRTESAGREVHDRYARILLADNDWNVDDAFAEWRRRREQTDLLLTAQILATMRGGLPGPLPETDDSLPATIASHPVPYSLLAEQERRGLITMFRDLVEERFDEDLTRAEAALWMLLHDMDPEVALKEYTDQADLRDELHARFDSLRRSAGSHEARSEALATLVTITDRADWYSLQQFLERFSWNFPEAVEEWHANGIPPIQHAEDRPGRKFKEGYGRRKVWGKQLRPMPTPPNTRVGPEAGRNWQPFLKSFCKDPADIKDPQDETEIIDQDGNNVKLDLIGGSLIRENRGTAKHSCQDPSKMFVELIKKDKYYCNDFTNKNFKFPGRDTNITANDPRVLFDWKNQAHLEKLNNWSRQYCERALGHKKPLRARAQRFSREELDMLTDFYEQCLQKLLATAPAGTSRDSVLPMTTNGNAWTAFAKRFNERFEGTMPSNATRPRELRTDAALRTQGARTPEIVSTYKVPADLRKKPKLDESAEKDNSDASDDGRSSDEDND